VSEKVVLKIIEFNVEKNGNRAMEEVIEFRRTIKKVLTEHAEFYRRANAQDSEENMVETVFDPEKDKYLLVNIALGE